MEDYKENVEVEVEVRSKDKISELLLFPEVENYAFHFKNGAYVCMCQAGSWKNYALFLSGDIKQWEIIQDEFGKTLLICFKAIKPNRAGAVSPVKKEGKLWI